MVITILNLLAGKLFNESARIFCLFIDKSGQILGMIPYEVISTDTLKDQYKNSTNVQCFLLFRSCLTRIKFVLELFTDKGK